MLTLASTQAGVQKLDAARKDHEQCRSCGVIKFERANKRAFSQAAIF
jgi:hypothetical protein